MLVLPANCEVIVAGNSCGLIIIIKDYIIPSTAGGPGRPF